MPDFEDFITGTCSQCAGDLFLGTCVLCNTRREPTKRKDPWKDPRFVKIYDAYHRADSLALHAGTDVAYMEGHFEEAGMPLVVNIAEHAAACKAVNEARVRMDRLSEIMRRYWV